MGGRLRADNIGPAGAILDHELLSKRLRQSVGQDTADDIRGAAGGLRNDESHWFCWPILRIGAARQHRGSRQQGEDKELFFHRFLPIVFFKRFRFCRIAGEKGESAQLVGKSLNSSSANPQYLTSAACV